MDNPIKYENLFDENLIAEVDELRKHLQGVKDGILADIKAVKKEAGGLADVFNQKPKGGGGGGDSTKSQREAVERLKEVYDKLGFSLEKINKDLLQLDGSQQSVVFTQKELNKVNKLGDDIDKSRETSYNALSKEYTALKIVINNLTEKERENNDEAERMVKRSKDLYEMMNKMQQATGKHQLSVGNYSKALNGMNIATTQVIRELPVLANGIEQFTIAIGNNIPILAQSIQEYQKGQVELKEEIELMKKAGASMKDIQEKEKGLMSTGKALWKTIWSWQSLLVVVLTVLPNVIRKMNEKRKEMDALTKSTKKNKDELTAWDKALRSIAKEEITATVKIRTLTSIVNDNTRSMEDRIDASKELKEEFPDELKGFTDEEIVLGKATQALDDMTRSIKEHARAKAIMNQITELSNQQVEQEMEAKKLGAGVGKRVGGTYGNIATMYEEWLGDKTTTQYLRGGFGGGLEAKEINKFTTETEEAIVKYGNAVKKGKELGGQIQDLVDMLDPTMLLGDKKKKKGGVETETDTFDPYKLAIEALENGIQKSLELVDYKYFKEREKLYKRLELGEDISEEEVNLEEKYQNERNEVVFKYMHAEAEAKRKQWEKDKKDRKKAMMDDIKDFKEMAKQNKPTKEEKKENPIYSLFMSSEADEKDGRLYLRNIEKAFNIAYKYMEKWMDMRMEMARIAVESAQKEEDSAKHALDIEQEARANGYAHNVEYARKEYEEKKKLKQEAMAEEQRLAMIQQKIDEAQQISSMLVATANIWSQYTKMGPAGVVLAGIATAAMFGSFAAAKIQASQLTKTKTYGEGMSEYLDYGGSHASGNDIDFGTMKDGTRRRVERGEMVAVINKRNVSKYGVGGVKDVIGSLNNGTFEDKYGLAFAGLNAVQNGADLSTLEKGMQTLVEQGEKRVVHNGDTTIEYYKNRKRIIKN